MTRRRRFATWLFVALGAVVGVVVLVTVVGLLLPRDHTSQATIELDASPELVWAHVSDFGRTPEWRPDVHEVRLEPPSGGGARFVETTGQGRTPYEILSQEPPRRQVVRVVDEGLPYGGTWTWELEPADRGARLTITEQGFVRNPIFRVVGRLFFEPTDTMTRYLTSLAAALGDSATPVVLRER